MKKVININFQGRVIPIEESAYEILQKYIDSLRIYFSREEGKDEIINDIEGRIGELFGEALKRGSNCITEEEVNTVINNIGRPEDFDDTDMQTEDTSGNPDNENNSQQTATRPRRLSRDSEDKMLGGVCAGIANFFRIDPTIVRILYAVISLGSLGTGIVLYLLLWILLPEKTLDKSFIQKRLFRNPDDRMVAGVAGGISAYLNIPVWIPRLIFSLPLIVAFVSALMNFPRFSHGLHFPGFLVFGTFGSTFFIIYLVLWIVTPMANSASEKLEMRGEKVDINTIRNTVQEDLANIKSKAEKWGSEVAGKAQQLGSDLGSSISEHSKRFGTEVRSAANNPKGCGHAIGVLVKAFLLFIAGSVAFGLLMATIGIFVGGISVFPYKNYILHNAWQNIFAAGAVLFIVIPLIALCIWLVRIILGARNRIPYLNYSLCGLWLLGLASAICLGVSIAKDFSTKSKIEETTTIQQPSTDKLMVKTSDDFRYNFGHNWDWDDDFPLSGITKDSLWLSHVTVGIQKSTDSAYHIKLIKSSRGSSVNEANQVAENIYYSYIQADSLLLIPDGFTINRKEGFYNQQVAVMIEVPIGKKIEVDGALWSMGINNYNTRYYKRTVRKNWSKGYNRVQSKEEIFYNLNDDKIFRWNYNEEYIMTEDGLVSTKQPEEKTDKKKKNEDKKIEEKIKDIQKKKDELDKKMQELEQLLPKEQKDSSTSNPA